MAVTRRQGAESMQDTASLRLEGGPDVVPRARRFTARMLQDAPSDLRDDAELVVTELVTNAMLHGVPPVVVRVQLNDDGVELEVEDGGHEVPVRIHAGRDAMTGRGLGLVSALASAWGVRPRSGGGGGKVVWAHIGPGTAAEGSGMELDLEQLLASWADDEPREPTFPVELGEVPTHLLLQAKAHIDNVVRELTLMGSAAAGSSASQLPSHLATLVRTVVDDFAVARAAIKRQAVAAAERGDPVTRLRLTLPASAAEAGERYLDALDEADRHARDARLLTLETPPAHRVFRRWYVQALVDQLRRQSAGEPASPAPTLLERLADEVTALAPLQELAARLTLLQKVTAELTGDGSVEDIAETIVVNATQRLAAASVRLYLLHDDGVLRALRVAGESPATAASFEQFRVDDDLPGAVALREGRPVVTRNRAELIARFPQLAALPTEDHALLVAPLIVDQHRIGVLSLTFRGETSFDEQTQLSFVTTLADVTAQALERAQATSTAAAAADKLAFLADASVVLSSSLDNREVLQAVADLVVPRLADWCVIHLLDDDAQLRAVAITHTDPGKAAAAAEEAARNPADMSAVSGPPQVVRTGRSELYADVTSDLLAQATADDERFQRLQSLGMTSVLVVPLTGRTGTIGAISMMQAESGRRYGDADVVLAEDLARRAALAVETAHAFSEQSGRLAQVTRVADAAQRAILATPPERLGPVALAARYVSAAADALIGGDLYEVVDRPGAVRLIIGDVRGKGLDAVRTATVVLGEFRAAASDVDDLAAVAAQIDRRVRRYLGDEDFVTALLAEIRDDGDFVVVSCGHPPALRTDAGRLEEVACEPGLPLGLGGTPVPTHGSLAPGDRLLLYTDGLLEARDEDGQCVDLPALARPLVTSPLGQVLDHVLGALRTAVGSAHLGDDLALVVAEYRD